MEIASIIEGTASFDNYKFDVLPRTGETIVIPINGRVIELRVISVRHHGVFYGAGFESQGILRQDVTSPKAAELRCERLSDLGESHWAEKQHQTEARKSTAKVRESI